MIKTKKQPLEEAINGGLHVQRFSLKVHRDRLIYEAEILGPEGEVRAGCGEGTVRLVVKATPLPSTLITELEHFFNIGEEESAEVNQVLRLIQKLQLAKALAEELT